MRRDKYTNYEKIKLTSSSAVFKTIFGKKKLQSFEILGGE